MLAGVEQQTVVQTPGVVRQLKLGIIGVGVGAAEILPAMEAMDEIDLMAMADINAQTRERFHHRYPSARIHDSAEKRSRDDRPMDARTADRRLLHRPTSRRSTRAWCSANRSSMTEGGAWQP